MAREMNNINLLFADTIKLYNTCSYKISTIINKSELQIICILMIICFRMLCTSNNGTANGYTRRHEDIESEPLNQAIVNDATMWEEHNINRISITKLYIIK